ncbi:MAG: hypothetical protein ABUT20_65930 [Bacteroidota bacterium]
MKNDWISEKENLVAEPIVIADECGDSMWDAVLQQEMKACDVKAASKNTSSLLNRIGTAQVSDTTEV